jgi:hypothetical protein
MFAALIVPGLVTGMVAGQLASGDGFGQVFAFGWTLATAAVMATVAVRQFFRRDVARALVWLGAGAVIAPLVAGAGGAAWARRWAAQPVRWSERHAERAAKVAVTFETFDARRAGSSGGESEASRATTLTTFLGARGVPPDLALAAVNPTRQTWRWPGGPVVVRDEGWTHAASGNGPVRAVFGGRVPARDEETERFRKQQNEEDERRRAKAPGAVAKMDDYYRRVSAVRAALPASVSVDTEVFPSTLARIRATPPSYEATVRLRLLRPALTAESPLDGRWHAAGGVGFRVGDPVPRNPQADAGEAQGRPNAVNVYSRPQFLFRWEEWLWRWEHFDQWRIPSVLIVHRAGGDRQTMSTGGTEFTIAAVGIGRSRQAVWQPMLRRGDKWVPRDPRWADGATLAIVRFDEEARFTREVKAERFEAAK